MRRPPLRGDLGNSDPPSPMYTQGLRIQNPPSPPILVDFEASERARQAGGLRSFGRAALVGICHSEAFQGPLGEHSLGLHKTGWAFSKSLEQHTDAEQYPSESRASSRPDSVLQVWLEGRFQQLSP